MKVMLAIAALLVALPAGAACPVGKKAGDRWCQKGMEWKCERCGSEYCPIITGRKCVKDDEPSLQPLPKLAQSVRMEADRLADSLVIKR